jgi:hypothetical protein
MDKRCEKCGHEFASQRDLRRHKEKKKPCVLAVNRNFICDICKKAFTENRVLLKHKETVHAPDSKKSDQPKTKIDHPKAKIDHPKAKIDHSKVKAESAKAEKQKTGLNLKLKRLPIKCVYKPPPPQIYFAFAADREINIIAKDVEDALLYDAELRGFCAASDSARIKDESLPIVVRVLSLLVEKARARDPRQANTICHREQTMAIQPDGTWKHLPITEVGTRLFNTIYANMVEMNEHKKISPPDVLGGLGAVMLLMQQHKDALLKAWRPSLRSLITVTQKMPPASSVLDREPLLLKIAKQPVAMDQKHKTFSVRESLHANIGIADIASLVKQIAEDTKRPAADADFLSEVSRRAIEIMDDETATAASQAHAKAIVDALILQMQPQAPNYESTLTNPSSTDIKPAVTS